MFSRLVADYAHGTAAPHALLLLAPEGIPSWEFALQLTQAVLCDASASRPCFECVACSRVQSGAHANLITLRLGSNERSIKIEQVRDLLNILALNPQEAGRRVILVQGADTMTLQAQNALLKSLEEPQAHDLHILCAANERAILPTILSRCRIVRMPSWPDHHVQAYLQAHGMSAQKAALAAPLAQGYPLNALRMQGNDRYNQTEQLCRDTFFAVRSPEDIPDASSKLKDAKEEQDLLLDILEQQAHTALLGALDGDNTQPLHQWSGASAKGLSAFIHQVYEARKYRASNVSWQAIADRLLMTITKEIYQCPRL